MKNTTFRVASLALCSLLCLFASPALAGWGSSGGYYGGSSGGSYGSSGSVAYYSSYGSSGGSHGHHFTPVRSVLRGISNHIHAKIERHQARRAYYGSSGHGSSGYGSSGYATSYGSSGYSTSYGSSGYSTSYGSSGFSTSYGSSGSVSYGSTGYGSTGASYGSTGTYGAGYGSTGTVYYGASNSTSSNPVFNVASSSTVNDAVYLTVNVPSNAKVYVNDKLTSSTGSVRQFVSRGLASGKTYKFDVRAELVTADGQVVTENKSLVVGAGADEQLQFAFSDTKAPVNTALTLNVPEGAKVTLAGNTTKATGIQRTFQSSHLKLGEAWDDYVVEVEHEGKIKRQSIRLIGGDDLALTFDFEQQPDRVASR